MNPTLRQPGNTLEILPAEGQDAREILALQQLAYQSEAAIYDDYSIPPLTETPKQTQQSIQEKTVLKAMREGRIIGSVRGIQVGKTCHIARLIVHPEFQNQGLGTLLMRAIEARFPKARKYELFTGERSERNLHLYKKLGYQITRKEPQTEKVNLVFLEKNRAPDPDESEESG